MSEVQALVECPVVVGTAGHVDHGKSALIEALTGKTETASVNGAGDLTYSYTTVLNGFSMTMPYGKIAEAEALPGVLTELRGGGRRA